MKPTVLGFAGMTHLGLVSAIAASEKGFKVVAFDLDALKIESISQGRYPVSEPQLEDLASKNASRLTFSSNAAALSDCDVIYVAPDVPTDDRGSSDLGPVDRLLDLVFDASRKDAIIVVLSQVPPGFTRGRQRDGRQLYYQVETLIFGRAIERALHPERYIVGCAEPGSSLPPAFAEFLAAHQCPILVMRYESAELAKISINMCLVASVSTANTLAELCERLGADWSEIVPALRLDRRIGQHAYLAAGLGIAGGNLERDLATVCSLADRHQTDAGVVRAWIANSGHRREWARRTIQTAVLDANPDASLAIWGLAYKENTHSVKNSPSLATISSLRQSGLTVHDPLVDAMKVGLTEVKQESDPIAALTGADALLILTPWPQYREIPPMDIAQAMHGRVVLDPYSVLDRRAAESAGLEVHTLGRAPNRIG